MRLTGAWSSLNSWPDWKSALKDAIKTLQVVITAVGISNKCTTYKRKLEKRFRRGSTGVGVDGGCRSGKQDRRFIDLGNPRVPTAVIDLPSACS